VICYADGVCKVIAPEPERPKIAKRRIRGKAASSTGITVAEFQDRPKQSPTRTLSLLRSRARYGDGL